MAAGKFVAATVCGGILGAAACLSGASTAHAADTVYFAMGGWNCSIRGDGTVGCDLNPPAPAMNVLYAGAQVSLPNVPAIIIDSPAMPAHPQWNSNGSHTLPGGNPALARIESADAHAPRYSISYAGATCEITYRGVAMCTSMGHGFSQWGPVPQGY
ncbi:hypothetical protein NDR87_35640 [Nocardia sp. CDC159]|uniref:Uncharacterized protein n=1 Tax=Nocardia pulmonis TaxID=2951408 RepID=A0A9X2J050_9NOCA|nr:MULTISPECIES: hypothetical protein [Nocardia]MCM6778822.1 hypothetical protein [Nocardia pulmonis]MCM6791711.1 hypothetical protein [Nocardia sp. CDC159]